MSVHVGEIHSQVTPAVDGQWAGPDRARVPELDLAEQIREVRRRGAWLAARVAAEGFED